MLAGLIAYAWSEAETVLSRYAALAARMPDELGVSVTMTSVRMASHDRVGAALERRQAAR